LRIDPEAEREDHRFILRFWREPSASGDNWRGSVYEVSSALGIASAKLRDLWDFIALRLGTARTGVPPGETPEDS
jgi:hypothetical protein